MRQQVHWARTAPHRTAPHRTAPHRTAPANLNKLTGEKLWQTADITDNAAYSSIVTSAHGGSQAIPFPKLRSSLFTETEQVFFAPHVEAAVHADR